jgi:hypothetical protein
LARKDSKELLKELNEFVVSDEKRVYSHSWQAGDLMVWDNRSLLHRARPYDYAQPRVLIGTRVAGDPETELSYYPQDDRARFGREALAAELALLREEVSGHRYAGTTATAFR